MRIRLALTIAALAGLAACGGPALETRTFELRYLDGGAAEQIINPYVFTDRNEAPGRLSTTRQTITVRETRDNLDRIARVLAEHDRPPANVRLTFMVIQADGAGPRDSSIAAIEAQLRQLFRFRGYRAVASAVTVAAPGTEFEQLLDDPIRPGGRFVIRGTVETVGGRGDSGTVRLQISLQSTARGSSVGTRLSIAMGQTTVLGGQSGGGSGALILAVRPELVAP